MDGRGPPLAAAAARLPPCFTRVFSLAVIRGAVGRYDYVPMPYAMVLVMFRVVETGDSW